MSVPQEEVRLQQGSDQTAPEMMQLSAVRQKRLLDVVKDRGAMSIRELCDYLQVSDATVRRDLTLLDRKGLLSRTHGGVVANSIVNFDPPDSTRVRLHEEEKQRIGVAAIEMLEGGETVMIDAGTTALSVAANAHRKPDCTFVTTSLGVSQILKEQGIERHYLIGGSYLPLNDSFCGSIAVSAIKRLSFDVTFLCVSSIDVQRKSISLGNEIYAQVQQEIIAVSRKNIVIADHSKFRASAFTQTASFEDLDAIITDTNIDAGIQLALGNEDLEIRLV